MSTDSDPPKDPKLPANNSGNGNGHNAGLIVPLPIEDELRNAYMTYAMSVIVSRALPDVRDGLKPSQRRILVAMNDLNLRPGGRFVKSAKISGDTSGNYHPHGESVIYPTLVRMAQEWNMRAVLVDKQGNWGSIAGLPAAAMRYTEARLSQVAALMLEDLEKDTVDFVPTYDEEREEPTVLPSKFPNMLVNGTGGIAVGMATSIPPHNLGEVCDALVHLIDNPGAGIHDLMEHIPGPDFPTGGTICGRAGILRSYLTGRGTVVLRARTRIEEVKNNQYRIIVSEIPYQQTRDRLVQRIAQLVNDDKIKDIREIRDESDLENPVRLVLELKNRADPDVVQAQLYQFSPLQDTFSIILLALVDGKPRALNLKELLQEFLRHRVTVIRRRTQFLLAKARKRKHVVEGILLALANLDEIIRIIRSSPTQAEAKIGLMGVECPASMMQRALGDDGFSNFQDERGIQPFYHLSPVQAEAILAMRLGQLVNLEAERYANEYGSLLEEITEYLRILSDEQNIYAIIKEELAEIREKHADNRRTDISTEELGNIDLEELIVEENMVVTISHRGYIKRTPATAYRAQHRGGKGLMGAKRDEEDPIEHLFVASTHAYLLFFTNRGKVYWQKVYDLPQLARDSKGRAIVNLLRLDPNERIMACLPVRDFSEPGRFLLMATRGGITKKTNLDAYSRPMRGGIIAIKLRDDDELVDVIICSEKEEVVLATSDGMAIRFNESDARPMGRNTTGVKGINLSKKDKLVSMVIADPEATLLTICQNGYGKRTPFGPSTLDEPADLETETETEIEESEEVTEAADAPVSSNFRYRTQRRGGKGLRDIKTTKRNGPVVDAVAVREDDEVMMITSSGKLQRMAAREISVVGRNTQGVRIMSMDSEDFLVGIVRIPKDTNGANGSEENGTAEEKEPVKQIEGSTETPETTAGDEEE
ncbi:DNA gyrase subunit A [Planctomycetales bacterium 10988]|nr:DNA gyrase subunit A [Planctomycetales bacterium 10988]